MPDGNFRERETVTPTAHQRRFDAEIRGTVRKTHALTEARAHQSRTARLGAASSRGNAASAVVSGGPCARACFSASDAAAYALPQAKCKWFVLRQPQRMDMIAELSAWLPSRRVDSAADLHELALIGGQRATSVTWPTCRPWQDAPVASPPYTSVTRRVRPRAVPIARQSTISAGSTPEKRERPKPTLEGFGSGPRVWSNARAQK